MAGVSRMSPSAPKGFPARPPRRGRQLPTSSLTSRSLSPDRGPLLPPLWRSTTESSAGAGASPFILGRATGSAPPPSTEP